MKKDLLVLEVNGRKNILQYQKTLYEAAVLGISNVMFVFSIDDSERRNEKINLMRKPLMETCDILDIKPTNTTVTFYGDFIGNSIGTMNENGNISGFLNLVKFSNFKRRKDNREKLVHAESFEEGYSKKIKGEII